MTLKCGSHPPDAGELALLLSCLDQLFSWSSVGPWKYPIKKMVGSYIQRTVRGASWVLQLKAFSETIFSKWINFQTRHCKEVCCHWNKISLSFQTARLSEANSFSPTVQLEFIWTFKMSDQQSYWFAKPNDNLNSFLNTCVTAKRLFKYNFFEMNDFRT